MGSYSTDFYNWTQEQTRLLKSGRFSDLDVESLVEEIESMGRSERRELKSRLVVLIMHLMKWTYQPERQSGSWKATIETQRFQILELLEDSPSLLSEVPTFVEKAYPKAKRLAILETGLLKDEFPAKCPFDTRSILTEGFFPNYGK